MNTVRTLAELQARDLMTRDVVVIPDDLSIQEAAERLCRQQVSGAPVIDHRGVVVGVLSSSDFVRLATGGERAASKPCDCVCAEWQVVAIDRLPKESVRRFMTVDLVTATEDTPVPELARMMVEAHIHRVIVVGGDGTPKGIVTTSNILGAVAKLDAGAYASAAME